MNASISGLNKYLLRNNNKSGNIEHKGVELTRAEALAVLNFGLKNNRETLFDITDDEVDSIIGVKP